MSRRRRRSSDSGGGGTPLSTCIRRAAADHQSARCSQLPRASTRTFVLRGIRERGKKKKMMKKREVPPPPTPLLPPTTPPASLTGSGGEGERRACASALCLCGWVARGGVCFSPGRTPADDRSINVIGLSGTELFRQAGREAKSGRQWTPSAGEMSSGG